MDIPGHNISKSYTSVFLLDVSKLSRLSNVIEERFKNINQPFISSFEIRTEKGKTFSAPKVESILGHDNTIKNPIASYKMIYVDKAEEPTNSCFIIFDRNDSEVDVEIRGDNPKWANDLFAEVDEQIERTFVHSWIHNLKKQKGHELISYLMPILMIPMIILSLISTTTNKDLSKTNFLSQSDTIHLKKALESIKDSETKTDFIFQLLSRQLANSQKTTNNIDDISRFKDYLNMKALFIILPVILAFICLIYLWRYCYPGSVFLWGDFVEHYNTIVERRKFVWNAIIIALAVGILGNLFVFGMSKFM